MIFWKRIILGWTQEITIKNVNILNFNSYFPLSLHFWSTDFSQELEKIKMVNYKHFVFLEQTTQMLEMPASACAEKAVRC